MSDPLNYTALLALAKQVAHDETEQIYPPSAYPPYDWRKKDFYRDRLLKHYIDRISPISYFEVIS